VVGCVYFTGGSNENLLAANALPTSRVLLSTAFLDSAR